ncbi:hypothetical protein P153DRAFT_357872 [Dothidotthia symphoricarpi CBS 119687]|uniref:Uncharacterized protein n=1 Tax=Dothidotthia symphoricarpi CBS 119687 TaxID=1392245 RepID=A0A6A6ACS5_9PLEO|nr:uncharacterized protein P153DRAFT_357872 [Dothidotthia symphoricarpi CBS 119687]KAF2128541.1 hypothetical protein P153DRAFT_357872 [Dothidotthia symphoricarpi CBS 119687]
MSGNGERKCDNCFQAALSCQEKRYYVRFLYRHSSRGSVCPNSKTVVTLNLSADKPPGKRETPAVRQKDGFRNNKQSGATRMVVGRSVELSQARYVGSLHDSKRNLLSLTLVVVDSDQRCTHRWLAVCSSRTPHPACHPHSRNTRPSTDLGTNPVWHSSQSMFLLPRQLD